MIFQGIRYYLPPSVKGDRRRELVQALTSHNATQANSVYEVTHVITNPGESEEAFDDLQDVNPKILIVTVRSLISRISHTDVLPGSLGRAFNCCGEDATVSRRLLSFLSHHLTRI